LTDLCRACGQPLPSQERGGVYLPPRKAMIFDTIKRFPGITLEGVQANCSPYEMSLPAIRVHICQINDMLAGTDLRIKYRDGCRIVLQDS
jgi:hypothetical protein